ncbi:MAG: ATPase [Lachnospiraceae bacterium]|nr:ATPase [Lachnospiraceae bacterium]
MNLKETVIGIEFGSTRIKAVMLDKNHLPIAFGSHEWENRLIDGVWTYTPEDIVTGLQDCYGALKKDVKEKFGLELTETGAIGVSAMMHGYLPFDKDWNQLTEFRTWRNTQTSEAAETLSKLFNFNIPQRWCIAHLYQAILNKEAHVPDIAHISTLAGYIHFRMTGKNLMGIGEASGVFPIDNATGDYDEKMIADFNELIADYQFPWTLKDLLPDHVPAGENAGYLTEEGALLLDPEGTLQAGIPIAPCEGDAGTGMVATNAVRPGTGNVSAGTSVFAMIVTDRPLGVHMEVGMVTTPAGCPVAMVHCSNCTSDINAWVNLLAEFAESIGAPQNKGELYTMLFNKALEGDPDCGGLLSYNYFSGEAIMNMEEGRPLFVRRPNSVFNLANFMRMHLLSALSTLKSGLDILVNEEKVRIDRINGHGGFFTTPVVGQRLLSAAIGSPVTVMQTAGEGGPYGMALLCAYMLWKEEGESLEDYLDNKVFADAPSTTVMAEQSDIDGFNTFLKSFLKAYDVERLAVEKF